MELFLISWTFCYMFLEPNYRGKGFGKEVTRMMMLYGNYYYAKPKDGWYKTILFH